MKLKEAYENLIKYYDGEDASHEYIRKSWEVLKNSAENTTPKRNLYNWSDVEKEYKYIARDGDGKLHAYKDCPTWNDAEKEWKPASVNYDAYIPLGGKATWFPYVAPPESLEKR